VKTSKPSYFYSTEFSEFKHIKQVATVMAATARIAAEHGSFKRIRQVAIIRTTAIKYMVPWTNASLLPHPSKTASR